MIYENDFWLEEIISVKSVQKERQTFRTRNFNNVFVSVPPNSRDPFSFLCKKCDANNHLSIDQNFDGRIQLRAQ